MSKMIAAFLLSASALLSLSAPTDAQVTSAGGGTQIKEVCSTPPVTASNAYGTNYVVGGKLTFANALPLSGGGAIQSVFVNSKKIESMGFTFTPFSADPSNTTWTDAAVAAINAADFSSARGAIALTGSSVLGTHTAASAVAIGEVINAGGTTLYGVLTSNAALTNNFSTTSDLTICVDVIQFP